MCRCADHSVFYIRNGICSTNFNNFLIFIKRRIDDFYNICILVYTKQNINFWEIFSHFIWPFLWHTTSNNKSLTSIFWIFTIFTHFINCVNWFFTSLFDKSTGVDDKNIGIWCIWCELVTRITKTCKHQFWINSIFVTAKRNYTDKHCSVSVFSYFD